ncbi:MAG TPA: hypothetical protein VJ997_02080, partial [Longimicrobiales bacterium]|nr:hypothetical protein [Longimicrobiales bacterium]
FYEALVAPYDDLSADAVALDRQRRQTLALFEAVVRRLASDAVELPDIDVTGELSFPLARAIEVVPSWQQAFLELRNEMHRLERLDAVFQAGLES